MNKITKLSFFCLITIVSFRPMLAFEMNMGVFDEHTKPLSSQGEADIDTNISNIFAASGKQGITLYQYNSGSQELEKIWDTINIGGSGLNMVFQPFIADADNDGKNELIGLDLYGLLVWDDTGEMPSLMVELGQDTAAFERGTAVVADIDKDGINEILVGFSNRFYIWQIIDGKLTKLLEKNDFPEFVLNSITNIGVGDTTGDGLNEIVLAGSSDEGKQIIPFYRWENQTLTEIGRIVPPTWLTKTLRVGDLNKDGVDEIVTVCRDGVVRVYNYSANSETYSSIWESDPILASGMDLGDVDGDGLKEIVIGTSINPRDKQPAKAFVFKSNGNAFIESWSGESPVSSSWPGVSIGDIDSDGIQEFIINGNAMFKYSPAQESSEIKSSFQLYKDLGRKDVRYGVVGEFNPTNDFNRDGSYRLFLQSLTTDNGDNNSILDPGEEVKVNVVVKSIWSDVKDVKVSISQKDSPYVKIIKGISTIDAIAANSEASTEKDPLIIKIADDAPAGLKFWFSVSMTTEVGYSNLMVHSLARDHDPYLNPLTISPSEESEQTNTSQNISMNYCEINEEDDQKENNLDSILANHKYVVLNIGATWCEPCKKLQPAYMATSMLFDDVYFVHVNIDKPEQNADPIKKRFPKAFVLPTILFFKDDKEIGERIEGVPERNRADNVKYLTEKIRKYFNIE